MFPYECENNNNNKIEIGKLYSNKQFRYKENVESPYYLAESVVLYYIYLIFVNRKMKGS